MYDGFNNTCYLFQVVPTLYQNQDNTGKTFKDTWLIPQILNLSSITFLSRVPAWLGKASEWLYSNSTHRSGWVAENVTIQELVSIPPQTHSWLGGTQNVNVKDLLSGSPREDNQIIVLVTRGANKDWPVPVKKHRASTAVPVPGPQVTPPQEAGGTGTNCHGCLRKGSEDAAAADLVLSSHHVKMRAVILRTQCVNCYLKTATGQSHRFQQTCGAQRNTTLWCFSLKRLPRKWPPTREPAKSVT